MKIQIIVQNYPPERGPVRYTDNLARFLACENHEVTVITGLPHYPIGKPYDGFGKYKTVTTTEDGIKIIRAPLIMGSNRQKYRRVLGFLSFIFSAARWSFAEDKPDIIIVSIPPATVAVIGWITSLIKKIPMIIVLRDIEPISSIQLRRIRESIISKFIISVFLGIYKKAQQIVVIHQKQADELILRKLDKFRITVIPHSIDLDKFNTLAQKEISFRFKGENDFINALYVGTIGLSHDIEQLLDLLSDADIQKMPINFHFIGDGERLDECQNLVIYKNINNIYFYKPMPLEAIPAVLKQADLLIVSYKDNPSSIIGSKILEYCASGKPVLVHGPESIRLFISRIGNGLTVKNGDIDTLCIALKDFVDNRDLWLEKGSKGKDFVEKNFSRLKAEKSWRELFIKLTKT